MTDKRDKDAGGGSAKPPPDKDEFAKFRDFAKKLVSVPKAELDRRIAALKNRADRLKKP